MNTALERFEIYVDVRSPDTPTIETASERRSCTPKFYPRHEGRGYGRVLVQAALDASRQEGSEFCRCVRCAPFRSNPDRIHCVGTAVGAAESQFAPVNSVPATRRRGARCRSARTTPRDLRGPRGQVGNRVPK